MQCHPYSGVLYLADSAGLRQNNQLKYGGTAQGAQKRAQQHAGQLSMDKSELIFVIETKDWPRAEALARAYFAQEQMHIRAGKELLVRDMDRAKALLRKAVELAEVRTALRVQPVEGAAALACDNAAWQTLLAVPVTMDRQTKRLAEWMAQSVTHAATQKRLSKKGLVCVNCDRNNPEFRLEFLAPEFSVWLESQSVSLDDLNDGGYNPGCMVFRLH